MLFFILLLSVVNASALDGKRSDLSDTIREEMKAMSELLVATRSIL